MSSYFTFSELPLDLEVQLSPLWRCAAVGQVALAKTTPPPPPPPQDVGAFEGSPLEGFSLDFFLSQTLLFAQRKIDMLREDIFPFFRAVA